MHYMHPKRMRGDIEDGIEHIEIPAGINDDSKDSLALKGINIFLKFQALNCFNEIKFKCFPILHYCL